MTHHLEIFDSVGYLITDKNDIDRLCDMDQLYDPNDPGTCKFFIGCEMFGILTIRQPTYRMSRKLGNYFNIMIEKNPHMK